MTGSVRAGLPVSHAQYLQTIEDRARMIAELGPHAFQWRGGMEN